MSTAMKRALHRNPLARLADGERRSMALVMAIELAAALLFVMLVIAPAHAAESTPAAAAPWRAELTRAAHTEWGLDAPIAALAAQVHQESGWNAQAVSRVGARGMAQFMPATATWWCQLNRLAPGECQPHNPRWALRALVGYDKWLWDRLKQAQQPPDGAAARMWATLRSYNGGLGHWQAEARLAAGPARHQVDAACGRARRHPTHCAENLGYPRRILATLQPRYATWGPGLPIQPE